MSEPGVKVITRLRWLVALVFVVPLVLAAAPDVALKDLDGRSHSVNEYIGKGKWTVVTVWSADCPICRREIHHMTFFQDEHKDKNATVLGISVDGYENRKKAQKFVSEHGLNFPNLIGTGEEASVLGSTPFIGTPTYYLFSPEGKHVTTRVGPATQAQVEDLIATHSTKKAAR